MPVTRRSKTNDITNSEMSRPVTRSSASSPIISIHSDTQSDSDFQPLPNVRNAIFPPRRSLRKRVFVEIDSSDADSMKGGSTPSTTSLNTVDSSRKKGKGKAINSFASLSSFSNLVETDNNTPASSVSGDFGTIKIDSDADEIDVISVADENENDRDSEIDLIDGDGDYLANARNLTMGSSDEESSTPLREVINRYPKRRREGILSRIRKVLSSQQDLDSEEDEDFVAAQDENVDIDTDETMDNVLDGSDVGDTDSSLDESNTPLFNRSRAQRRRPIRAPRGRARRNRAIMPQKTWVSI